MAKASTNISLDAELKKQSQDLFSDLGKRELPNAETITAMNEYYEMKAHPENYKKYSSFREAMNEVLTDA